jgi:hypothetical protein
MITTTNLFEGRTLENVFGNESEYGRCPNLHLGDLSDNFKGQAGELIIMRLALATVEQLMELRKIKLVSVKRIRKRLELALGIEVRRDDETTLECLKRFVDVMELPARIATSIDLDNPLKYPKNGSHVSGLLQSIFMESRQKVLTIGYFRTADPELLEYKLARRDTNPFNSYQVKRRIAWGYLAQLANILSPWGIVFPVRR